MGARILRYPRREIRPKAAGPAAGGSSRCNESGASARGKARLTGTQRERKENAPAETLVEFLAGGGSVALTGRREADGSWAFEVAADEAAQRAYLGKEEWERPDGLRGPTGPVENWEKALAALDCWAWAMCAPKQVHPEFRQDVWGALLERTINAPEYCADILADRLFEWEDFCIVGEGGDP
jgi:hypothetical protein